MRTTLLLPFAAFTLGVALAAPAAAACRPASGDALTGPLGIRAQVLVAAEAAQPYVVVRCYVEGALPAELWIPVVSLEAAPRVITVDAWDRLWDATAPRAIVRGQPSAAVGELPRHDLSPEVAAVLSAPRGPVMDAAVALVELDTREGLPEGTAGVVTIRPSGPLEGGTWTPWVRLALAHSETGEPLLPVLPEAEVAGEGGRATIETTFLFLGSEHYWALAGFDLWDAIDRSAGGLGASAEAVAPNPVLVLPDPRVNFNRNREGGFAAFFERRVAEVTEGASFPVALLQYAGGLGRRDGLLPQPEPLEWYAEAHRLVRERLDYANGTALPLTTVGPTLYLPVWVTRPIVEVAEPTDPADIQLTGDAQLFGFGAERLGELTPTMVRRTIEEHVEVMTSCDPGGDVPVPVELQLMVEPGGTTVGAFISTDHSGVSQCLIDNFSNLLFPLATGSPVGVRFPIVYQQR